jgi:hypothetical protein
MSLKFSPGSHRYWLDKKPVPGVTTLLGKGMPKPALPYWSARTVAEYVADNPEAVETLRDMGREPMVAALKGVPWQKRDEAAVRGTDVHAIAERVVHGLEVDVPEHLVAHVQGYVDWLDTFKVEPVLTERSVGNRAQWYAGRFDLIADMGGWRWLLDVKTSTSVYGETAMQTDAYRNAEFYVDDDDPDTEHPMPEGIERLGVIHVTEHGSTLYPLQSDGAPFRVFKHVAYVAKQQDAIKAYLNDPITDTTEMENLR